jgi:protein required for attachment to host cells
MGKLKIPHDAIIFVGDGRKALFLRNEGDEKFPNLKTEKVFEQLNPSTHEQGSERPGRVSESHSGRRSAIEPVDWHDLEERRFARQVAAPPSRSFAAARPRPSSSWLRHEPWQSFDLPFIPT